MRKPRTDGALGVVGQHCENRLSSRADAQHFDDGSMNGFQWLESLALKAESINEAKTAPVPDAKFRCYCSLALAQTVLQFATRARRLMEPK